MRAESHPFISPVSGAFASYIDIDPLYGERRVVPGFERTISEQSLRYTPITISQEELLYHKNINYEERRLEFPRFLEQMFENTAYKTAFQGVSAPPFRLKFVEQPGAKIKVCIGITMYQEACSGLNDIRKVCRSEAHEVVEDFSEQSNHSGGVPGTIVGVLKNVETWLKTTNYKWEEICVCLLADGRTRIDGQFNNLQALARMGMYIDVEDMYRAGGLMDIHQRIQPNDRINIDSVSDRACTREKPRFTVDGGQTVYVHLFENTVYYEDYPPMQFMFALKEFNAGKLDTHLWFFEGFAHHFFRVMNERTPLVHQELYCVCIDAGTRPKPEAIVKLVEALDSDPSIAGVCGEITVDKGLNPKNVVHNWTVAAQNFEYKIGNLLDKCCESVFGFISVLPGAFSAYRWSALSPPELACTSALRPIVPYFRSVTHGGEMNAFYGNMYLAEDRVLCLELVCSRFACNVLRYVEGATAVTDVPDCTAALTKQRRRWLNGSFFAQLYAIWQALFEFRLWRTRHSVWRKILIFTEFMFFITCSLLVWFLPGIFYISFLILWRGFLGESLSNPDLIAVSFVGLQSLYLFLIFTTLVLAMGTPPDSPRQPIRFLYSLVQGIFGVLMLATLAIGIRNIVLSKDIVLASLGIANTAVFFLAALLHGQLTHVLCTFVQYTFLQPTYVNVFQIFAFCNTHDLSWGTKGLDSDSSAHKDVLAKRIEFKTFLVVAWSISNMLLAFVIDNASGSFTPTQFMKILLFVTLSFNSFRFLGSCIYLLQVWFRQNGIFISRSGTNRDSLKQQQAWDHYHQSQIRKRDWREGTPYDRNKTKLTPPETPNTSV